MGAERANAHRLLWLRLMFVICVTLLMIIAASIPLASAVKPVKPPVVTYFTSTTIESRGDVGEFTRLALDGNNDAHIIYYDQDNYALKYATDVGGSWAITILDIVGDKYHCPMGGVGDIVIDDEDTIHVIYYNAEQEILYMTNTAGSWSEAVPLGLGFDVWGQPSLAVDGDGILHLSYYEDSYTTGAAIIYAYGTPGAMTTELITDKQVPSWSTSLTVDSSNVAHVAYVILDDRQVIYANSADGWAPQVVGQGDIHPQIAIGPDDSVHAAYFTYPERALMYACLTEDGWVSQAIDGTVDANVHWLSLTVDDGGKVHISYDDYVGSTKPTLMYATNADGSWVNRLVDGTANVGRGNDIAVGSDLKVHISYLYQGKMNLMYAVST